MSRMMARKVTVKARTRLFYWTLLPSQCHYLHWAALYRAASATRPLWFPSPPTAKRRKSAKRKAKSVKPIRLLQSHPRPRPHPPQARQLHQPPQKPQSQQATANGKRLLRFQQPNVTNEACNLSNFHQHNQHFEHCASVFAAKLSIAREQFCESYSAATIAPPHCFALRCSFLFSKLHILNYCMSCVAVVDCGYLC